jgi:hypothetical protein
MISNVNLRVRFAPRGHLLFCALALNLAWTTAAGAQPSISGTSGQWQHGATVTVTGSGFGSKPQAAPLVWDDASGSNVLEKWDGAWPSAAGSNYNMAYRTPIRGIQPPHSRTGRYLAGSHASEGADRGYNVMVWKRRQMTYPSHTYASWYMRMDDNWVFGDDDNLKNYAWAVGPSPYEGNYWYIEYNARPTSRTSNCAWALFDSAGMGLSPAMTWGSGCTNPMSGQWVKVELMIRWSKSSDGFVQVYENGRRVINYTGRTDGASGTTRTEGIGGFARMRNTNNWRYYTDIYLDTTLSHVIIGNASTLSASTKREVQIPTSWSNNSITLKVNLGAFSAGQTAYLYVFDSNGNANSQGYPVVIGGGGTTTAPTAPKNLRIVPTGN